MLAVGCVGRLRDVCEGIYVTVGRGGICIHRLFREKKLQKKIYPKKTQHLAKSEACLCIRSGLLWTNVHHYGLMLKGELEI